MAERSLSVEANAACAAWKMNPFDPNRARDDFIAEPKRDVTHEGEKYSTFRAKG